MTFATTTTAVAAGRRLPGLAVALALLLSACGTATDRDAVFSGLTAANEDAALRLAALPERLPAPEGRRLLITAFADVDNLDVSSTFGRISADQVGAGLARRGWDVVEARMRPQFAVNREGEFMLSRELGKIAQEQRAGAVLVGTYAVGGRAVHVSLRILDIASGRVIESHNYAVTRGADVEALVRRRI